MMLTTEEKREWLSKATNEQLINQLRWAVEWIKSDNIELQVEGNEDYRLVTAEMLKRMSK